MSRWYAGLVFLSGCIGTNPCADLSDCLQPGRLYRDKVQPYGGVCIPNQGANLPLLLGGPFGTPPPGAGNVQPLPPMVPGAVPFPGPGGFVPGPGNLQPPPPTPMPGF